jgi:hypothetical protein
MNDPFIVDGPMMIGLTTNPYKVADAERASEWDQPRVYRVTCIDDDPECYIFQGRDGDDTCIGFIGHTQREHFDRFDCRPIEGDVLDLTTEGARILGVRFVERTTNEGAFWR